jgi:hypothetical protein
MHLGITSQKIVPISQEFERWCVIMRDLLTLDQVVVGSRHTCVKQQSYESKIQSSRIPTGRHQIRSGTSLTECGITLVTG